MTALQSHAPSARTSAQFLAIRGRTRRVGAGAMRHARNEGALVFEVDDPSHAHLLSSWPEAGRMGKGLTRGDQRDRRGARRSGDRLKLVGSGGAVDPPFPGRALMVAIEDQIVPRLVLAHSVAPALGRAKTRSSDSAGPLPTESEIGELANISTSQDLSAAVALVQSVHDRGVTIDMVLLRLVAPAAQSLKSQWESDLRTFTDVMIGHGTLQLLIHVVGARFTHAADHLGLVVLVAAPSARLSLSIYLYEEFLRRDGCDLVVEPGISEAALLALIGSQRVTMLGISVTRADISEPLARLVAAVKKASVNPAIAVVLNGDADLSGAAFQLGAELCSDPRDASYFLVPNHSTSGTRRGR